MCAVFYKSYEAPPFDTKEILRYARCKEADDSVLALMQSCIDEVKDNLTYKVCYTEFPLSIQDDTLDLSFTTTNSSMLQKALSGCQSYILFAATVGLELDRLIAKYGRISPVKALFLQAIGAERIESLCAVFCAELQSDGRQMKPRVSPGYGDLSLDIQKEIFAVLDCPRKIGLTLNDSQLMTPTKSVTAFIGVY